MKRKRKKISKKVLVYVSNVNNFVHNSKEVVAYQEKTNNTFESVIKNKLV
jgi:hypothetical protein